jgi:hypothetical protein
MRRRCNPYCWAEQHSVEIDKPLLFDNQRSEGRKTATAAAFAVVMDQLKAIII